MAYMFGAVAVVIEVTKYNCFQQRRKRFSLLICVLLTMLSIGASVGSLQNGLQSTTGSVQSYERKLLVLTSQQEKVQASIDKLIAMEHVTKAVNLLPQLEELQTKIDQLEQPDLSASYGLVKTVSELTGLRVCAVSNGLYVLIAVILDLCAFTLLAQTEQRSTPSKTFLPKKKTLSKAANDEPETIEEVPDTKEPETLETFSTQQELFLDTDLLEAIQQGNVKASVRSVMSYRNVGYSKAKQSLEVLVDSGELSKTGSGRYQLK